MSPARFQAVLCVAAALALASCAIESQTEAETPVAGPATAAVETEPAEETAEDVPESATPAPLIAEGLRLPNMLNLPAENQFRATNPIPAATRETVPRPPSDPVGLIARPPVEPPRDD